ncbi:hypothetical protein DFP72DRAFT_1063453 [Ephemerocybe angulata]|uniref:Uncharacterized protein n=1 Tax=Ephemerocybe angulata TaxID=980116 RepID=A0A8H6I6J1_9AGAR|nr:hypothetical protein DFP72DRAFT_1063453 [Tulosesus angulatus]
MTPGYGSRPALRPTPSPETRYSYGLAPVNMNTAQRAYGSIRELPTGHPPGHTAPPGYLLPPHLQSSGDYAHSTPHPPPPARYVPGRATNMSYAQALASPKPRPVHRVMTAPRDPMGQLSRGHHPDLSSPHLHFHAQPPSSYHQPSRQPHNYYHHPHQIPPGPHPPGYPSPFPLQVRNQHPEQYHGGMGGRAPYNRGPENTYWRRNVATKGNSRQPAHPASIQTNYRAPPGLEGSRRVTPAGLQPCYGGYRVAQHPETRPVTPAKTPPQLLTIDSGVPSDRADSPHNLSPLDFNGPSARTFGSSAYQSGATIVPDAPATPPPGSFTQEDAALVTQSLLPRLKFGNFSQSKSGEVQRSRILYSIVSDPKSFPQAKSTCDDDVGVVVFMPLDKKGGEAELDSTASYTSGTSDVDGGESSMCEEGDRDSDSEDRFSVELVDGSTPAPSEPLSFEDTTTSSECDESVEYSSQSYSSPPSPTSLPVAESYVDVFSQDGSAITGIPILRFYKNNPRSLNIVGGSERMLGEVSTGTIDIAIKWDSLPGSVRTIIFGSSEPDWKLNVSRAQLAVSIGECCYAYFETHRKNSAAPDLNCVRLQGMHVTMQGGRFILEAVLGLVKWDLESGDN